jgi:hypothetical protein
MKPGCGNRKDQSRGKTCKVAETIEEAREFIESGFEFVTDMDAKKLFRKRKCPTIISLSKVDYWSGAGI